MNDDQLFHSALNALERGNAARAHEHLAALDEPSAQAWHLRALAFEMDGNEARTTEAVQRGLSMDPTYLPLRLLWGDLLSDTKPADAEAVYLSALNDFPTEPSPLLRYAWLLATKGDAEGARVVMDRVPGHVRASDPQALGIDGIIALSEGRTKVARNHLDRGLEIDPNSVFLHSLQAMLGSIEPGGSKRMIGHMNAAAATNPRQAADLGYEARYLSHPLLAPARLVDRVGTGKLWLMWIAFFFGGRSIWPEGPFGWFLIAYLVFALYTWVAPPLLRLWLKRKGEL